MPYVPDWEPLPAAAKRIMASNVEESEAKADLCHAIADRKVSVRVTLAGGRGVFSGGNVAPPLHLEPDDLDWDNSRPKASWSIGPMPGQTYAWLDDWEKKRIDRVEVSTADVLDMLCPSRNGGEGVPKPSPAACSAPTVDEAKGEPTDLTGVETPRPKNLSRIASYLDEAFPAGRPPISNEVLRRKIKDHVGGISPRTLSRAINELSWTKR